MTTPVELRQRAHADLESAVGHYMTEAGADVSLRFIDAVERAFTHLAEHPLTGSLRWSYELDIPELRSWRIPGFPYLVFYVADAERIAVWRVLHMHRDLPGTFGDTQPSDVQPG